MNSFSPHLYKLEAQHRGLDKDTIEASIRQYESMLNDGILPILSLKHLANLTNVDYSFLRRIVGRKIDPYKTIEQPKRSGGTRLISAPQPRLKAIQRWILDYVLRDVKTHPLSFAYENNKSILDCAKIHIGMRWMIKFDLRNFFDSVKENRVYKVFRTLGYSSLVSFEMTRICTRKLGVDSEEKEEEIEKQYPVIHTYVNGTNGCLPQGAPTSGKLANIICFDLDERINHMAIKNGFAYSRYSDDIFLSGCDVFDRKKAQQIISCVSNFVHQEGFSLQKRKTHVITPGARKIVLGLTVTDQGVKPMREFRKQIEHDIYGVKKFGLVEHVHHRHYHSLFGFINHVDGCIAFVRGIDSELGDEYKKLWEEAISRYDL